MSNNISDSNKVVAQIIQVTTMEIIKMMENLVKIIMEQMVHLLEQQMVKFNYIQFIYQYYYKNILILMDICQMM